MLTRTDLKQAVKIKLKETSPRMFHKLEQQGQLEEFLEAQVEVGLDTLEGLEDEATLKAAKSSLPPMEAVKMHQAEIHRAEEVALSQALDFPTM
jgi:hypothetical protein